jgi:hypothetical protein
LSDEQKKQQAFRDSITESMSTMSYTALLQELRHCEHDAGDLLEKARISHHDNAVQFYQEGYKRKMVRIEEVPAQIERALKRQRTEE